MLVCLTFFVWVFLHPVPDENIATPHRDAGTIEGQGGDVLLNGDTENYTGENGYTTHSITRDQSKGITVQLGQPYIVNCIRMLLWDKDNRLVSILTKSSSCALLGSMIYSQRDCLSRTRTKSILLLVPTYYVAQLLYNEHVNITFRPSIS